MKLNKPLVKLVFLVLLLVSFAIALSVFLFENHSPEATEHKDPVKFKKASRVIKEGYTFEDQLDALIVSNWVSRNKANLLDKISSCKADSNQGNCEAIIKKVRFLKGKFNADSHAELYSMLELHSLPAIEGVSDHRVVTESPLPVIKNK